MGARISSWKLARSVSSRGELGITSGVAMDIMLIRELQIGDPEGIWRRSMAAFPDQDMVQRLIDNRSMSSPTTRILLPEKLWAEISGVPAHCRDVWWRDPRCVR